MDETADLVARGRRRHALGQRGDGFEHLEIVRRLQPDAGPLHLHGNRAAVAQHGAMHLRQRRRRQRRPVQFLERVREPHAQLLAQRLLDVDERHGRDLVLEARERGEIRIR